jgi:hypothetical protein
MAISGGPDIVEDGLVLYLDTADPNSLPPGQSIKDLVTGTAFSGANYNTADWSNNVTKITICLWWQKIGNSTQYSTRFVRKDGGTSTSSFVLYHFHNFNGTTPHMEGLIGWYANRGGNWGTISSYYNMSLNETVFMSLQFDVDKGGGQMWANDTKIGSRVGGANNLGITNSGPLGLTGLSGDSDTTRIYTFACYDRELSDEQILQNYNATKGRYGL